MDPSLEIGKLVNKFWKIRKSIPEPRDWDYTRQWRLRTVTIKFFDVQMGPVSLVPSDPLDKYGVFATVLYGYTAKGMGRKGSLLP